MRYSYSFAIVSSRNWALCTERERELRRRGWILICFPRSTNQSGESGHSRPSVIFTFAASPAFTHFSTSPDNWLSFKFLMLDVQARYRTDA